MGTTVQRSVVVRRPVDEVAAIVTDPRVLLPIIGGLGRFKELATDADGFGEWDLFLDIGAVDVGGRVIVERPGPRKLAWHAIRGTRHQLELTADEMRPELRTSGLRNDPEVIVRVTGGWPRYARHKRAGATPRRACRNRSRG